MEESNRFGSFAPQRSGDKVTFYVDGEETFKSIYEELSKAKEEVLISSYFFSPELILLKEGNKRDWKLDEKYSLYHVLKEKATSGVKVWIFCWDETNIGTKFNSRRVKKVFKPFKNVKSSFSRMLFFFFTTSFA